MNYIDFKIPTALEEARALMKQLGPAAMPVAGSTLHVFLRDETPKVAIDISRLGLNGIHKKNGVFDVGATTTVTDMGVFRGEGWVLNRIADAFVTQPIRNMATLGGSIVRVFPWSDWPVAMLALDAEMVITGDTGRVMSATDFFASQPFHHFQPGDLLTLIRVPALTAGQGFGYHKERRSTTDFSRCTVAARLTLEGDRITDARVAIGAAVPMPIRVQATEQALIGKKPGSALFEQAAQAGLDGPRWKGLHGISDEYARHLAGVLMADVLQRAHEEAKGQ